MYFIISHLQARAGGREKCSDITKCSQQETAEGDRGQNLGDPVCLRRKYPGR